MRDIQKMERELACAKARKTRALTHCTNCNGAGFWSDSTYVRSGEDKQCQHCYGTGFPRARIAKIIADAFSPFARWPHPTRVTGKDT